MAQEWAPARRKLLILAGLSIAIRPFLRHRKRRREAEGSAAVARVLVVELGNIGDIVLLTPFLTELRHLFPRAALSLLAKPEAAEILAGTALVDEFLSASVITGVKSTYNPFAYDWRATTRLLAELRRRDFDLAFQCRLHIREHLLLALSGAHRTFGYAFRPGAGDKLLTDARPRDDTGRHKAEDWLRLLDPLGGGVHAPSPHLRTTDAERMAAREFLASRGAIAGETLIAVHPGASVAEKRWPIEHFTAVVETLSRRDGVRVVAMADPDGYGAKLGQLRGVVSVQGMLRQVIAVTECCDLLVCNDSGPMHIAAALGVPTVALFGPGNPQWFGPLGSGHRVLMPEPGELLADIPVERVVAAAVAALESGSRR